MALQEKGRHRMANTGAGHNDSHFVPIYMLLYYTKKESLMAGDGE